MYTNKKEVPVALAVMLATDNYDYDPTPNLISASSILKPLKSLIISKRIKVPPIDIMDIYKARMGTAIHDAVEQAWKDPSRAMALLGYPPELAESVIESFHSEIRTKRELGEFIISGKFDFCINGRIQDIKTTGTFGYTKGSNTEAYRKQLSIYKWLNPNIVTENEGDILYWFPDWKAYETYKPTYPRNPIMSKSLLLMPDIEQWLIDRLDMYEMLSKSDNLPDCTKEELMQDDSKWQYFPNPDRTLKASKNFDNYGDAVDWVDKKGKGIILEKKGKPIYCKWCPARTACVQAEGYLDRGELEL